MSRPDFINLTFASNLIDLGESCLAKVNIDKIFNEKLNYYPCDLNKTKNQLLEAINSWASKNNKECNIRGSKLSLLDIDENIIFCYGYLQDWLGDWKQFADQYDAKNLITFHNTNKDLERLLAGILLSWVGIRKMEEGGYLESATKEYLELANATLNIVWWYLILKDLNNKNIKNCKNRNIEFSECFFITFLIEFAISCLESALNASLKNRIGVIHPKRNIDAKGSHPEFNKILPEIITIAFSVELLIESCGNFKNFQCKKKKYELFTKIAKYTGITNEEKPKELLIKHLKYNRYPMLNRLRGLSILVYYHAINEQDEIDEFTSTIINYNDTYDAPFHYTYLELGICAFLSQQEKIRNIKELKKFKNSLEKYVESEINNLNKKFHLNKELTDFIGEDTPTPDELINKNKNLIEKKIALEERAEKWFKDIAFKNLKNSIGSHSMGKSYYENITKLYYLYDDFNDRRIHLNQAMQMLGTSMAEELIEKINL